MLRRVRLRTSAHCAFSDALGGRGTSLRAAGVLVAEVLGRGVLFAGRAAGVLPAAELPHS